MSENMTRVMGVKSKTGGTSENERKRSYYTGAR